MSNEPDVSDQLAAVAFVCQKSIQSLRKVDEEKWTEDDAGMFQLCGAYLTLYERSNLDNPEIQLLLELTCNACILTLKDHQEIGEDKLDREDQGVNLMCHCFLILYRQAVEQGILELKHKTNH